MYKLKIHHSIWEREYIKLFSVDYSSNPFRFAVLCDWHWGSPTCCYDGIREFIRHIKKNKIPWVSLGDLLENSLVVYSAGSPYDQDMRPSLQEKEVYLLLKDIKDLCLGMINGNHEFRSKKAVDISITANLANRLGIADRYFNDVWAGIFRYEKAKKSHLIWRVWGTHGSGGGWTIGGKLNSAIKAERICSNADLYLSAHSHSDVNSSCLKYELNVNKQNQTPEIKLNRSFFQVCGAGLNYFSSYAVPKLMPPAVREQLIISLKFKRKQLKIENKTKEYYYKILETEKFLL